MKILSIDSSAVTSSVALTEDGKILCSIAASSLLNHSETLLMLVDTALRSTGLKTDDVDAFAVAAGPGSFTGVRIGVSLIKGLAFGRNKPCVGVSTLEALAYNIFPLKGIISPVMDARRDQVYNALFECDGEKLTRLCPDRALSLRELKAELENKYYGRDIFFVGDGYGLAMNGIDVPSVMPVPELLRRQNAASVGLAAYGMILRGDGPVSDKDLRAVYLRMPQAERERLENNN